MPESDRAIAATIRSPYGATHLKSLSAFGKTAISPSLRIFMAMLSRMVAGTLDLTLPDGSTIAFVGRQGDQPKADLTIHHPRAIRRLLTNGKLGFCEAYLDQDWNSSDAARLFELALLNKKALTSTIHEPAWLRFLKNLRPTRTDTQKKRGALGTATMHYDLGNTFYAQWLDPSMTYSGAVFKADNQSLIEAQNQKYAQLCQRLVLQPHHRVLELGCGWGGFAEYAAREYGVRVTAITNSPAQYAYANNRIHMAGLADRADIQMIDYRDVAGQYDRIVSIEMIESIGASYWPAFFRTINERLTPGGRAELQIVTVPDHLYENYRSGPDYIERYIYPDNHIPSPKKLHEQIAKAGLIDLGHISFGPDYARTKRQWLTRFQENWPQIQMLGFDARFRRMWELYLQYCEAGFAMGTIDVIQKSIAKPHDHTS